MKRSPRNEPPPPKRRRWGLWFSIVAILALGVWVLSRTVFRKIPEPEAEGRRGMDGERAGRRDTKGDAKGTGVAAASPSARTPGGAEGEGLDPAAPAPFDPAHPPVMTREQWIADRQRLKEVYLEKSQYPIESRPLAHKTDLLLPNHVEPMSRPLKWHDVDAGEQAGKVTIQQNQDRIYLKPGDTATARLQAFADGKPIAVDTIDASFHRVEDRKQSSPLATVTFADDGVAPDEAAGDLTYTARFTLTPDMLGGYTGPCAIVARTKAQGEDGEVDFRFLATAKPPAKFTGVIREALEQGSLALYAGIEVETPGKYIGQARLYDANERPISLLSYNVELPKGPSEIRLFAYGKLIRDEGSAMPLVLRDLEGWRMLDGVYPDREVMAILDPRFKTRSYPLDAFTDKPWTSPEKDKTLKTLDDATASGMPPADPSAHP